jgi:hypothetical protein
MIEGEGVGEGQQPPEPPDNKNLTPEPFRSVETLTFLAGFASGRGQESFSRYTTLFRSAQRSKAAVSF